ncbi:MAG: glutaredoxin family protein [Methylophagaceae bacterium]
MTEITLYTTAGCHLCELADAILKKMEVIIKYIEIGDNDDLVARYGTSIPVLKFTDDSELNWPFEQHDITDKILQLS